MRSVARTRFHRSLVLSLAVLAVSVGVTSTGNTAMAQSTRPAAAAAVAVADAPLVDVPVRGVTLFSSGVGYFQHLGNVTGDGAAELRFKSAQINDILKSLVLQDLDGGRVSSVNYASQEPLDRKLRSFQVDISGSPTLAQLMGQLRGARVTVDAGGSTVSGTVLGVEKRQVGQGQAVVERSVMSILTGASVRSVVLDDVREIKLDDPALQEELTRALEALAGARDQEKKTVSIRFSGAGDRRVRVGYVVETPVWKTSYRLLMGEKPSIQGWAIVENQTDHDWKDVQLSLVSGRPISFVQDLYTPLFVPRPVVVPELFASLRPQEYGAGTEGERGRQAVALGRRAEAAKAGRAPGSPAPSAMAAPMAMGGMNADALSQPMDPGASVQSLASAAKVGELFQYTVGSVSLPRQTSAMIPIVTDPLEVEKVSIYNASVMPRNPLNGARVKNTTGKHLLAGPVTVLDGGTYAGDARIDNLPPGQERLLSYGVDLQMTVDAVGRGQTSQLQTARVSRGVLTLVRKTVSTQEYLLDNKSDAEKTVVVEHPRMQGWKLVDSPEAFETTDALYRFKDKVPANKAGKLVIKEETVGSESIVLADFDSDAMFLAYAQSGEIPAKVRQALERAAELKRAESAVRSEISVRTQRIAEMTAEQSRLRENLKTVQPTSEYAQRLLKKLNDQETAIETLQSELEKLATDLRARQKELADYLASLSI